MQANFDLEEFIAYLLNGCLLLIALNFYFPSSNIVTSVQVFDSTSLAQNVVNTLVFGAAALLAGHISSVVSRSVIRKITWCLVDRPRNIPFKAKTTGFWTRNLCDAIQTKTKTVFGELELELTEQSSPRLIRSYVLSHSEQINEIRIRIVRARSLCANAILPLLLFSGAFIRQEEYLFAFLTIISALLLALKQHDLDTREWKEIYLGFLAL